MRVVLLGLSLVLSLYTLVQALYKKKQFYPTMVYLSKSKFTVVMAYFHIFVSIFLIVNLIRRIFLGTLRDSEYSYLYPRFCFSVAETTLVFSVLKEDFSCLTFSVFTSLLFLKAFHWLAEYRIEILERAASVELSVHLRISSFLIFLSVFDYLVILYSYTTTLNQTAALYLVAGYECFMLLTINVKSAARYVLYAAEIHYGAQWQHKTMFLLIIEVILGFIKLKLYILFSLLMSNNLSVPLSMFHPILLTLRNFIQAVRDVVLSWKAISIMNRIYPDATPEELQEVDNLCVICREEMINRAKKLPCGHIFHMNCLYNWFQRQRTCPVCRFNVLRERPAIQPPNRVVHRNVREIRREIARNQNVVNVDDNRNQVIQSVPSNATFYKILGDTMLLVLLSRPPFAPTLDTRDDLSNLTAAELLAMEDELRVEITEKLMILNNMRALSDAASGIMTNYEQLMSRIQQTNVAANAPMAGGTATIGTQTTLENN